MSGNLKHFKYAKLQKNQLITYPFNLKPKYFMVISGSVGVYGRRVETFN
jgi:hypothetical protein